MSFFRRFLVISFLALSGTAAEAAPSSVEKSGSVWQDEKILPASGLRGFGKVSASFHEAADGSFSLLEMVCEDEAKAKLTVAKYLSDLDSLPGVKNHPVTVRDMAVDAWEAEGQGVVAAIRSGKKVYIAAGKTDSALGEALTNGKVDLKNGISKVEIEVPMWLDRWDKFGFRFYYRPWETPKDVKGEDYDFSKEFDFAKKNDSSGFLFWTGLAEIDTTEGMTNEPWWNWALRATRAQNLPVALNIAAGGTGSWFFNRYRDEMTSKMPQYCGGFYKVGTPYFGGHGMLSWNATTARDADLGILQDFVKRAVENPNVVSVLEPHGELRHGAHDIFIEYGPVADKGFRRFLEARYEKIDSLNAAWGRQFKSWQDVRVPEVASFLGWGPQALDLTGDWKVNFEPIPAGADPKGDDGAALFKSEGSPDEWYAEKFDDSSWPVVTAPGHDRSMFLPRRPAVYRQTFELGQEWLKDHPKVWLYLWDLNAAANDKARIAINGKILGESKLTFFVPHWGALDVTAALRPGKNQLSIRLPKGFFGYRIYLSGDEPRQYPNLGKEGNSRWVDFSDWIVASRLDTVKHGMEMIRQVEPNRPITLMAPDSVADGIKQLAVAYGGNFHNTGHMGVFWNDYLPSMMQGANLPFSLEPGAPAKSLAEFKKVLGLYSSEGIQGIDYFIHVGDIMWDQEIRKYFEDNLPAVKLIGKYHVPKAEVAALYSTRGGELTGYPWGQDLNTNLPAGYWAWNVRAYLMGFYESNALTESAFSAGEAAPYRVIIDTNTSILDDKMITGIENYVRDGGTFVTFVQTGRHTPIERDSWPISKLTGFKVVKIDRLNPEGNPESTQSLKPAPGQEVFNGDWNQVKANGLTLEAMSAEAVPLMLWADGSIAVGMRKIGKGQIIQVGCKFTGKSIFDRVEPPASQANPTFEMRSEESRALTRLFSQILDWQKIPKVAGTYAPENLNVITRHYLSNNGLYNVWTLFNQSGMAAAKGDLALDASVRADWAWDVVLKKKDTLTDSKLSVPLEALQTRDFLTPRNDIVKAPLAWFELQRDWWRQSKEVKGGPLPVPPHRFSLDLDKDWFFKALGEGENGEALATVETKDADWEKVDLGVWSLPDKKDIKHAILRKSFTVPATWGEGDVAFSLKGWLGPTFVDQGRIWLDGKLISDWSPDGVIYVNPDGVLKPGSSHMVAVEIKAKGFLAGERGNAWLWVWPKAETTLDLAGTWSSSMDVLHYDKDIKVPGEYKARSLRREILIPAEQKGKNVLINVTATGGITGVLINGNWVRRLHHHIGSRFDLNITPWVKFGEKNEIELVGMNDPADGVIQNINLGFHRPDLYP